jgi:TonB family protein
MNHRFLFVMFLLFGLKNNVFGQQEIIADELPYFAGCQNYPTASKEKRACSMSNLAYYLNNKLIYPDSAKEKGTKGIVYVSFTVDKKGWVSNTKVLNDIGDGCGAMAKKVVESMPAWEPAQYKGEKIAYDLRLPIQFSLDDGQLYAKECRFFWGDLRQEEIPMADLTKYLTQPILVRDQKGELMPIINVAMFYENGRISKKATCKTPFNKEMEKIIRRAKAGGTLTFAVTLQKKGTFFELIQRYQLR